MIEGDFLPIFIQAEGKGYEIREPWSEDRPLLSFRLTFEMINIHTCRYVRQRRNAKIA